MLSSPMAKLEKSNKGERFHYSCWWRIIIIFWLEVEVCIAE